MNCITFSLLKDPLQNDSIYGNVCFVTLALRALLVLIQWMSRHMTGLKSLMYDYRKKYEPIITYGDHNKGVIKGFGTIMCKLMKVKKLFHVESLQNYLISILPLCDIFHKISFDKEEGIIVDSRNSIVVTTIRKNNFYMFYDHIF